MISLAFTLENGSMYLPTQRPQQTHRTDIIIRHYVKPLRRLFRHAPPLALLFPSFLTSAQLLFRQDLSTLYLLPNFADHMQVATTRRVCFSVFYPPLYLFYSLIRYQLDQQQPLYRNRLQPFTMAVPILAIFYVFLPLSSIISSTVLVRAPSFYINHFPSNNLRRSGRGLLVCRYRRRSPGTSELSTSVTSHASHSSVTFRITYSTFRAPSSPLLAYPN